VPSNGTVSAKALKQECPITVLAGVGTSLPVVILSAAGVVGGQLVAELSLTIKIKTTWYGICFLMSSNLFHSISA
jgi:hypothetical protein